MSSRIQQVLDVLQEVKEEYLRDQKLLSISSLRIKAVHRVADKLSINERSVADKYIRQLRPQINNTNDFDIALSNWLIRGENYIHQILLSKMVTHKDKEHINHFFENLPVIGAAEIVSNERIDVDDGNEGIIYPEETSPAGKYLEGTARRVAINSYERNPKAKKDCVAVYRAICSVCAFNFEDSYGEIGKDFIHVHHLQPISTVGTNYVVDPVADLRPVCPNCHAMIHKRIPPFAIDELKRMLRKKTNSVVER